MVNTKRIESNAGWIVSPAFDLCFLINVWWILISLLPEQSVGTAQQSSLAFWQIYFITTPHRWITLLLVASDPDKRQGRTGYFLMLAVVAAFFVGGARWTFGGFACLAAIEYTWNAWHFGAQHGGILRIYSLKAGGGSRWLELNTMRLFPPYVSIRLVAELNGWLETVEVAQLAVNYLDIAFLAFPFLLIGKEVSQLSRSRIPKLLYLLNVYAMYAAMLVSLRLGAHQSLIMLTLANAAFHAVEYLAIVTFYANKRKNAGSDSLFQRMAKDWLRVIAIFIIVMGVGTSLIENSPYEMVVQLFIGANLWAAFMHYTYDGIIWKLRKPQTAKTLGVEG